MKTISTLIPIDSYHVLNQVVQITVNMCAMTNLLINAFLLHHFYKMSQFFFQVLGKVQSSSYRKVNYMIAFVIFVFCLVFIDLAYVCTLNTMLFFGPNVWNDIVLRVYAVGIGTKLLIPITIATFVTLILVNFNKIINSEGEGDDEDAETNYNDNPSLF